MGDHLIKLRDGLATNDNTSIKIGDEFANKFILPGQLTEL